MAGISPGWAVELIGERIDLDDFRESLKAPFSPWIEDYPIDEGAIPLLRSTTWAVWESSYDASYVFQDATRIIERLNGEALLLHSDAQHVKLGRFMKFDTNGKSENIVFPVTGRAHGHVRVRGRAHGIIGTDTPPLPRESNMQRWFAEAERDGTLADLFSHLNRADNWFDLYKSAELARRLVGGERALKKSLSADCKKWERVWITANCYRHAPDPIKYLLPTPPADLGESKEFILTIIPRLL